MKFWIIAVLGLVGLMPLQAQEESLAQSVYDEILEDTNLGFSAQYPDFMAERLIRILELSSVGELVVEISARGRHWLFCRSFVVASKEAGQTKLVIYEEPLREFWRWSLQDRALTKIMLAWGLVNEMVFLELFSGHPTLFGQEVPEDQLVSDHFAVVAIMAMRVSKPLLAGPLTKRQKNRLGGIIKTPVDIIGSSCQAYEADLSNCSSLRPYVVAGLKLARKDCQ